MGRFQQRSAWKFYVWSLKSALREGGRSNKLRRRKRGSIRGIERRLNMNASLTRRFEPHRIGRPGVPNSECSQQEPAARATVATVSNSTTTPLPTAHGLHTGRDSTRLDSTTGTDTGPVHILHQTIPYHTVLSWNELRQLTSTRHGDVMR